MPVSNIETRGRFCDSLGSNIMAQYSVALILLPFMAELLKGGMWTGWVFGCIHDSDVISEKDAVFQDENASIHTAECSVMIEEHESNFNIPPRQHNYHI
jgi:hypothetical protein